MPLDHVLYFRNITILPVDFIAFFLYLCICLCLLCIVVCMHTYHSEHIFMVYNSVQYVLSNSMFLSDYNHLYFVLSVHT